VAVDETAVAAEEAGVNVGGNVLTNDNQGADRAVEVTGISSNYESAVGTVGSDLAGEFGSLTISANGAWTYEPNDVVDNDPAAQDVFTYTITDADGDTSEATITINLSDTEKPVASATAAMVDDDGLPLGNEDSPVAGDESAADSDSFSGTLNFTKGGDIPVTVSIAAMALAPGNTDTVGTELVTYEWEEAASTLSARITGGDRDNTILFAVKITDANNGDYTVNLLQNVLHADADGENNATATISYVVTDDDGVLTTPI